MAEHSKYIGKVIISDPDEVQSKCTELGISYYKGMVFCTCLEIGFKNYDLIPCRYGLSFPYIRVKEDWELLIEPTLVDSWGFPERWFYVGIADCGGGDSTIEPTTDDRGIIEFEEGIYLIQLGDVYLKIDNSDTNNPVYDIYNSATANIKLEKEEITQTVNASGLLKIKTTGVELGAGAEPMVLGTTLQTLINIFITVFNAHVHPVPGVTAGPTTVSSSPTATPGTPLTGTELSTKHKVD